MLDLPGIRTFRLQPNRVSCDGDGLFVGSVALLRAGATSPGAASWTVRPEGELNEELSACYGLPIDVASKSGGLASVARALDQGNLALATVAALLLKFPDPPVAEKALFSSHDRLRLAADLIWSGLLKGDWDPHKHPRTGASPNRGWFAIVEEKTKAPKIGSPASREIEAARKLIAKAKEKAEEEEGLARLGRAGKIVALLLETLEEIVPTPANPGEDQALERQRIFGLARSFFDSPKTLEELQAPSDDNFGYDNHHMVNQNDANVAKKELVKFGQAAIDADSNLVSIPRLKHWLVTAWYNSKYPGDPEGRLRRDVISEKSFDEQREIGLEQLRAVGVLK
jgi:hypothetical protein